MEGNYLIDIHQGNCICYINSKCQTKQEIAYGPACFSPCIVLGVWPFLPDGRTNLSEENRLRQVVGDKQGHHAAEKCLLAWNVNMHGAVRSQRLDDEGEEKLRR